MDMKVNSSKVEHVSSDICLKNIPAYHSKPSEVDDYIVYYYGLDFYDQWRKQQEKV